MSRVLFVHCLRRSPSAEPRTAFNESLGVMSAALRNAGHATRLLTLHALEPATIQLEIKEDAPDFVYLLMDGTAVDLSRRVLAALSEKSSAPVIVGGPFASLMPSTALSMPGVHGVVVGEAETVFPAHVERWSTGLDKNAASDGLRGTGLYLRGEGRLPQFPPAPLVEDLDSLPFADRALFHSSPAQSEFEVVTSRGCPMSCAYCVNEAVRSLYDDPPNYVRRRSPDHICDEIDRLCEQFPSAQRIRFPDHAFAMNFEWLDEFAEVYAQRCGLPFSCHVRAACMDDTVAERLADAGCDLAEVEIISGSNFIRNEILDMDTTLRHIERAFEMLRNHNIATHSVNYVGVPYSTEITEQETVRLNRRLAPDVLEFRVYYPFPNTKAAGIAKEMDWLSHRGESCYSEDKSVLDMPTLPAKVIDKIARTMPEEVASGAAPAWLRALARVPFLPGKSLGDIVASLLRGRWRATVTTRRP